MLITKFVDIKISSRTYKYYKELGYLFFKNGDSINVDVNHLTKGSKIKVNCKCTFCHVEKYIHWKDYIKYISLHNFYSCYKCCYEKIKITNNIKYNKNNTFEVDIFKEKSKNTLLKNIGYSHPMFSDTIKKKVYQTCYERHGYYFYMQVENNRQLIKNKCLEEFGVDHISKYPPFQEKKKIKRIEKGTQIPDYMLDPFFIYRRKVHNLTNKNKSILFENWNGYDYYDNTYIKNNIEINNGNYPSIDHKVSVYYGFKNNISEEVISDIENLCITKRSLNAKKGILNEDIFKIKQEKGSL